jgi:hypothetical protein
MKVATVVNTQIGDDYDLIWRLLAIVACRETQRSPKQWRNYDFPRKFSVAQTEVSIVRSATIVGTPCKVGLFSFGT